MINKWLIKATAISVLVFVGLYLLSSIGEYKGSLQTLGNLEKIKPSLSGQLPSIIRISTKRDFVCSGVVIGSNYVLTAAHCLADSAGNLTTKTLYVSDVNDGNKVKSKAAALFWRQDLGIIQGDFSKYKSADIFNDNLGITEGPLVQCGFPGGNKNYTCVMSKAIKPDGFLIATTAEMFPGMSGGPVVDLLTNKVVGVNSRALSLSAPAVSEYAPTIGVLGYFKIE